MLPDNKAIVRLGEKASGSGGKSEDQPLSVTCQTTLDVRGQTTLDVRVCGETNFLWNKKTTVMIYIFIVALEFVLAFTGVGMLIRYYNHK